MSNFLNDILTAITELSLKVNSKAKSVHPKILSKSIRILYNYLKDNEKSFKEKAVLINKHTLNIHNEAVLEEFKSFFKKYAGMIIKNGVSEEIRDKITKTSQRPDIQKLFENEHGDVQNALTQKTITICIEAVFIFQNTLEFADQIFKESRRLVEEKALEPVLKKMREAGSMQDINDITQKTREMANRFKEGRKVKKEAQAESDHSEEDFPVYNNNPVYKHIPLSDDQLNDVLETVSMRNEILKKFDATTYMRQKLLKNFFKKQQKKVHKKLIEHAARHHKRHMIRETVKGHYKPRLNKELETYMKPKIERIFAQKNLKDHTYAQLIQTWSAIFFSIKTTIIEIQFKMVKFLESLEAAGYFPKFATFCIKLIKHENQADSFISKMNAAVNIMQKKYREDLRPHLEAVNKKYSPYFA